MMYVTFKKEFSLLSKKIRSCSKNPSSSLFGEALLESRARDQAFHIEALLRLVLRNNIATKKQTKFLEKLLQKTKSLEDTLGKMDEYVSLQKKTQTLSKQPKDHSPLLRSESTIIKDLAESTYGSKRWVNKQISSLRFLKKWSTKKSRRIINQSIASEIVKLTAKTTDDLLPALKTSPFSYELMEYKFHEYRRALRWIPIYVQTLQNQFTLSPSDKSSSSTFEKMILEKYRTNPFTQLPNQSTAVALDRFSYYMFSHSIAVSGIIKDEVETHFKLKELHVATEIDTQHYQKQMIAIIEEFLTSGASWRLFDSLSVDSN